MIRSRPPRLSCRLAGVVLALVAGRRLPAEPEPAAAEAVAHAAATPAPAPSAPATAAGEKPASALSSARETAAEPATTPHAAPDHSAPAPVKASSTPPAPDPAHESPPPPAPAPATAHEAAPAAAPGPAPAHHSEPPAAPGAPAPADHSPAKGHGTAASAAAPDALPGSEIQSMLKLGGLLTDRGDYDAAEIAFRQVLHGRGVPLHDTKSALLGLARMHRRQGALTKAAAIYEAYLKEYPEDERTPDALLDLGRTIRGLGTYNLAIARFYSVINSTLKLPGDSFEHYQLLAKTAQFEIAETYFQAGNFAEAGKFFTRLRLLDLAPSDRARAHFKAAFSQHLEGQHAAAIITLRAFLDQSPEDENVPEARYLLAVTLRALNRPQEAFAATLELLRTAQSTVATNPKLWAYWQRRTGNQLANDFFSAGNIADAHAIYLGLAELSPEPVWRLPILYQAALCQERLGFNERAVATYRSIIDTAGPTPDAELAELSAMAKWRLSNLDWTEQARRQVTSLFETTTGRAPVEPPLPAAPKTTSLP
jgi:tetratricopeptide (TPR) repeat protein